MSRKKEGLNCKQIRACELLTSGWLSVNIAKELNVRPETISIWKRGDAFQALTNHLRNEALFRSVDRLRSLHLVALHTLSEAMLHTDTPASVKVRAAMGVLAAGCLTDKNSLVWDTKLEDKKVNLPRDAQHELELKDLVGQLEYEAYTTKMRQLAAIGMDDNFSNDIRGVGIH
jgi:hypothetical protein